jgi:hypothetical protein
MMPRPIMFQEGMLDTAIGHCAAAKAYVNFAA